MSDKCVCCGNYVPEGRMVCKECEERSFKENEKPMKKKSIIQKFIALILGMLLCLSFVGCSKAEPVEENNTELEQKMYENILVDIATEGGGYYSTYSNVLIGLYGGELTDIVVYPNALLAYQVSDRYEGGVCLIDGIYFEKLKSDSEAAKQAIADGNTELAKEYIEEIYSYLIEQFVYDYCPT